MGASALLDVLFIEFSDEFFDSSITSIVSDSYKLLFEFFDILEGIGKLGI